MSVCMRGKVVPITPVLDTAAFASGDLMNAGGTKIPVCVPHHSGIALLESLTVIDAAAVKQPFDVLLFGSPVALASLPAVNAPIDVSDAEMQSYFLGAVSVAGADFKDTASNSYATYTKLGLLVQSGIGVKDLYAVLVARAASTYGAAGLTLRFGFRQS